VRLTRRGPPVRASGPEAEFVIVKWIRLIWEPWPFSREARVKEGERWSVSR
jgi:hypothetical protein